MSSGSSVVLILLGLAAVAFIFRRLLGPRSLSLPPGPKGWPLLGNTLDLQTTRPWEQYHEWCKIYKSDIIYLRFPSGSIVVLDTIEAANNLLESRSSQYSDRTKSTMFQLLTWDTDLGLLPYGAEWRAQRKVFHQHFQAEATLKYRSVQLQQTRRLLSWIAESPENTSTHVRRMVISITRLVVHGKTISSWDEEYVCDLSMALESFSQAALPGEHVLELLLFLKYVPGAAAKSKDFVKKYKPYVLAVREKPYAEVKAQMDAGSASPSVTREIIDRIRSDYGGTEAEEAHDQTGRSVAFSAYAGSVDTTSGVIEFFLLAMTLFPEVQRKAQAELHTVVGSRRLPDFGDLENLPYLRAVIMETWRWIPLVPINLPHSSTTDGSYKGCRIPKGTACFANIWAMTHNPADYPEPGRFQPERFIGPDGHINPDIRDPATIAFGFGRRRCPGQSFASVTVSICAASLLHVFDISSGVDAAGHPVQLGTDVREGFVSAPKNVPCGLFPRSASAATLIQEAQAVYEDEVRSRA